MFDLVQAPVMYCTEQVVAKGIFYFEGGGVMVKVNEYILYNIFCGFPAHEFAGVSQQAGGVLFEQHGQCSGNILPERGSDHVLFMVHE
jgi:hypothetical protein